MNFSQQSEGNVTEVSLSGKVDSVTATDLEKRIMALLDGGVKNLLIDCTHLSYINSAGLRVFLLAAKQLNQIGSLAFYGLAANVKLVFETIGFDRILTIHPDRQTALKAMNTGKSGQS